MSGRNQAIILINIQRISTVANQEFSKYAIHHKGLNVFDLGYVGAFFVFIMGIVVIFTNQIDFFLP